MTKKTITKAGIFYFLYGFMRWVCGVNQRKSFKKRGKPHISRSWFVDLRVKWCSPKDITLQNLLLVHLLAVQHQWLWEKAFEHTVTVLWQLRRPHYLHTSHRDMNWRPTMSSRPCLSQFFIMTESFGPRNLKNQHKHFIYFFKMKTMSVKLIHL